MLTISDDFTTLKIVKHNIVRYHYLSLLNGQASYISLTLGTRFKQG
ncbi:hypothetical protein OA2633_07564 [Oceanicaulis sp. HTCC2633]|nr:hypothetical protein OA2633_07564 [Oceanicaulis sp. HTCC2633]